MRTGAIFARGSCRALAWVLALGVAAVLSGGEAVAQTMTVKVAVPDKLVLTPSSGLSVNEGAPGETFTVQLQTKLVDFVGTGADAATVLGTATRAATAGVTVTLSRAAATDGAHFIVGGIDTHEPADGVDAIAAGGAVTDGTTPLAWTFNLPPVDGTGGPQVAALLDPTGNKFVSVNADEDANTDNGSNALVLASDFSWDHDGAAGTAALALSGARMTISETDNDTIGVTISERALTVLEGGDGEEYTVVLTSEPEHDVMVTVAVTSVNANIMVNKAGGTADTKQTLTFTGGTAGNWNLKQTVTVTAGTDLNTINGSATIKHTTESDDPNYHKIAGLRSIAVTEIDSVRTITLSQSSDTVMEGESFTITATLESDTDTPVTLGGDVTVKLTGATKFSGDTSFKISAGSTAGSTKLTAKHDMDEADEDVTLTASVSAGPAGIIEIPNNKVKVKITDDDEYTLEANNEEVNEGDEVMLTVKLTPAASMETKVMIDLYRASGATVAPAENQDADEDGNAIIDEGETSAKFTLKTAKDANDSNDEVVVARAMAGGKVVGDPVTIMVRDTQAAANFTLSVAPDAIGEADGEASVMVTVMADKAVSAATTLTLAVDDASTAMDEADYSIMSADMMMVMIEKGEKMGMTTLMVTPVADGMDEPNETIVLTAWMDDAQVGNAATLTIIDSDSMTFMLSGPSDMNVVEGFEYDIEVTASTPVKADTTVMLMRGDASTATADEDYMIEDIMIMAGETMGRTKLMVKSDDMADGGSDGSMAEKLVLYGMVGNMRTNELSFYIWDLAVPALPVIGQLLLAALMAIGGYRRYRRR